jgi:hypothetical protein
MKDNRFRDSIVPKEDFKSLGKFVHVKISNFVAQGFAGKSEFI